MTDAAIANTQSIVERFTEQYLRSLDSSIEKMGERWEIRIPNEIDTELPTGDLTLVCGEPSAELDENEIALHPESSFFRELVAEASQRLLTGRIVLDSEDADIEVPAWLRESPVDLTDVAFTPYYDRTATVMLYRIRIETVSAYQTELLRAIAIDEHSMDELPNLAHTVLDVTAPEGTGTESKAVTLDPDQAEQLIEQSRQKVVNRIQPKIDEIHQEASRAADAELEEYRQLQQQRLEELQEKKANLSSKIDELSSSIQDSSGQGSHVEELKQRKECKSELEEVEAEIAEIKRGRQKGFPAKQKEIRDRHALEVVVSPLTITQVEYERGEAEFELAEGSTSRALSVGYGRGVGITEELQCEACGQALSNENPVKSVQNGIRCSGYHS